jgi:hypothetical protein
VLNLLQKQQQSLPTFSLDQAFYTDQEELFKFLETSWKEQEDLNTIFNTTLHGKSNSRQNSGQIY